MRFESILALGTLLLAIATFYFPYRATVRKDKENRLKQVEEERKQSIADAVKPVQTQLEDMTKDRDFWRNQVLTHSYPIVAPSVEIEPRRPGPRPRE